ncbi:hypothetical protein EW146_g3361 [Bondarzewia mesenterica]|uniref:Afadin and alpha-actinin-binding-domain-containing protein n=1 Tax=Bondarzewia mesenterica TaxID=1095465 RepID=A0A4S4LXR0_9AGAM|nr:hypothetical protein EW146_g3361 [Bondarzewia mesenterica]
MDQTPAKLVHWNLEFSNSPQSPFSDAPSTDSVTSTSTLQYVNSQLISHGYTHSPGLSLDGLSNKDSEKVVKCLFSMLSQRMEDMNRTEELTTKLRTLSYDHERLLSMHRTAVEKSASSERETNLFKSRLATATRTLQQTEAAHKHTTGELQRTRSSLQAIRATHQAELKKKEKEVERMTEKWSKLSDTQLKLGNVGSGMIIRSANGSVVEGRLDTILGKGRNLVDLALEQAEEASKHLREETGELKTLIVDVTNAIQKILHKANGGEPYDENQPNAFTTTDLFPLGPPDVAFEKLSSLLTSLRSALSSLLEARASETSSPTESAKPDPSADAKAKAHSDEVEKLKKTIDALRFQLEQAQKETSTYATQTQALFDQFTSNPLQQRKNSAAADMDLTTAQEKEQVNQRRAELKNERAAVTEDVLRLSKERANLEAKRIKLLEEKRSWQVQVMLADLGPTPVAANASSLPYPSGDLPEPTITIRKSPRKSKVKINSPRKTPCKSPAKARTRSFRRASSSPGLGLPLSSRFVPSFETEVIPSSSLMPTSFVLPPPSPQSRFPPRPSGLLVLPDKPAIPQPNLHLTTVSEVSETPAGIPGSEQVSSPPSDASAKPLQPSSTTPTDANPCDILTVPAPVPKTPRPFPMAKPFAQRMIHAYSPAKPSPLSRILMLANSPEGEIGLTPLGGISPVGGLTVVTEENISPALVASDEDDSPFRYKKVEKIESSAVPPPKMSKTDKRSTAMAPEPVKRSLASALEREKEKGKMWTAAPPANVRSKSTAVGEKENVTKRVAKASTSKASASTSAPKVASATASKPAVSTSGTVSTKGKFGASNKLPPVKSGPRRVPIDSAEAAMPIGPGWRG